MKFLILTIVISFSLLACGQRTDNGTKEENGATGRNVENVKLHEPDVGAMMQLLRGAGYELYSFDLSNVGAVKGMEFREYKDGEEVMRLPDAFPENDVHSIDIGFYPSNGESVRRAQVMVNGERGRIKMNLNLYSVDTPEGDIMHYETRPYVHGGKIGEGFVPLVMLGSGWWDAQSKMIRFCGVTELEVDDVSGFTTELLGQMPHYYIIGINVKRK